MKKVQSILIRSALVALLICSGQAMARDPNIPSDFEFGGRVTDTGNLFPNELVLYQRLDQRTLRLENGTHTIPARVEIIDHRPVDDWYKEKNAKAVLYFNGDMQMQRVEIHP